MLERLVTSTLVKWCMVVSAPALSRLRCYRARWAPACRMLLAAPFEWQLKWAVYRDRIYLLNHGLPGTTLTEQGSSGLQGATPARKG